MPSFAHARIRRRAESTAFTGRLADPTARTRRRSVMIAWSAFPRIMLTDTLARTHKRFVLCSSSFRFSLPSQ